MNDLQKEWLEATDKVLIRFKDRVKNGEKLSLEDAINYSGHINSGLNDDRYSAMWSDESKEKWQEIKNLFSMLVEPAYFVSENSSSSVN